ncbi:hypothetical protein FQA39_LY10346 [Lamprigera yunnana]|nr:hypothetical protein FQA39_LY10346 [Lamprigera yunnana]
MNFTPSISNIMAQKEADNNVMFPEDEVVLMFENDAFFNKYQLNNKHLILPQLNDLLMWLNNIFVPFYMFHLKDLNKSERDECLYKTNKLEQTFSNLQNFSNYTGQCSDDYAFTCTLCGNKIKRGLNSTLSAALQEHVHLEEALANLSFKTDKREIITTKSPQLKELVCNGINFCNYCYSSLNIPTDFKFNFKIFYCSEIEKSLYTHNYINDIISVGNLSVPTFQLKNSILCVCLLCICDLSVKVWGEHQYGQKHLKNKSNNIILNRFVKYHIAWMQQEPHYQAHQVYFTPFSVETIICNLCNDKLVPLELIEDHINNKVHKVRVFQLDSNVVPCYDLQIQVYPIHERVLMSKPLIEPNDLPSTSTDVRQNYEEESEVSEESDLNDTESIKEENPNKALRVHEVIPSITENNAVDIHNIMEHRFWFHFDKFMKVVEGRMVECCYCNIIMPKIRSTIIGHILSKYHKRCVDIPKSSYKFFCEICNLWIRTDNLWLFHKVSKKHVERCRKIATGRRKKLIEYECKTCKLIFFGDDISIKRHSMISKYNEFKKPKNVVLSRKVKKLLVSNENIICESNRLVAEAVEALLNRDVINRCCNAIRVALLETYPNCSVYPFGSQVSGLGTKKSDLDLFVDISGMYFGEKSQDPESQVSIVLNATKIFRKRIDFKHLNPIPKARTPILQLYHVDTDLDCDLSFRHGLSVENTKFLRLCIDVQPCTQLLILFLKEWLHFCNLAGHITTYSLAMMVIFYLQVKKYLIPVNDLQQLTNAPKIIIDGWSLVDLSTISVEKFKKRIRLCKMPINELLIDFFVFYKSFNYATDVICPLLGHPIKKSLFSFNRNLLDLPVEMSIYIRKIANNTTELFRSQSSMCIQDPFDLSHNLTKGCSNHIVNKFQKLCDLSYNFLIRN